MVKSFFHHHSNNAINNYARCFNFKKIAFFCPPKNIPTDNGLAFFGM